jgi:hypothetical protein
MKKSNNNKLIIVFVLVLTSMISCEKKLDVLMRIIQQQKAILKQHPNCRMGLTPLTLLCVLPRSLGANGFLPMI